MPRRPDMNDFGYWYIDNRGVCNHCGLDLKTMDPAYNIWPHWTGACVDPPPPTPDPSWREKLRTIVGNALLRMGI